MEIACAASCLADLVDEIDLSDEPAFDAGTSCPESRLISLLDQLHVASEPTVDLESVSSTDPMIVDFDTASLDAFPTNVVVYDEPPPREYSGGSTVTEVLVINSEERSDGHAQDSLEATLRDLLALIPEGADAEVLEAHRLQLVESAGRLASMRRLSDAYRREMDRAVGGTPAPGGPSRLGMVQQHGTTVATMFGLERPVYATPVENIRAAQAVTDELNKYDGDELRHMTKRVQQLLDAAAAQHEAACRAEDPAGRDNELPPRRDHGATSRTPTGGARGGKGNESAASRSRTRISIERDEEGRPRAVERRGDLPPPPPRGARYPTPPLVTHPTLDDRLGRREGVEKNDARHRIDRLNRSLALEAEDALGPPCFSPRIRDEPFPKGFTLPRDTPKYTGFVKPED